MMERVVKEMTEKMRSLTQLELYDKNLVRAVNCRVIPVAGYAMNVCRMNKEDLVEMDMIVKRELREKIPDVEGCLEEVENLTEIQDGRRTYKSISREEVSKRGFHWPRSEM